MTCGENSKGADNGKNWCVSEPSFWTSGKLDTTDALRGTCRVVKHSDSNGTSENTVISRHLRSSPLDFDYRITCNLETPYNYIKHAIVAYVYKRIINATLCILREWKGQMKFYS